MSRANMIPHSFCMLALAGMGAGLGGCASSAQSSQEAKELAAYQAAIEAAMQPATAEEIAIAERSDPLNRVSFWAEEYRKDKASLETTVRFLRALRTIGSHERVLEVVQQAYPLHPESHELLLELGRSFMAQNKPIDAAQAFVRAADYSPADVAAPLAGLGVALDHMDRHDDAQEAYREALARQPDRVSTLSNYGVSLALTGNLEEAEAVLRKAVSLQGASSQVRQNLALVLGLQGRFDEMSEIDPAAPRGTTEANKEALRAMLTPERSYSALEAAGEAETADMPTVSEGLVGESALSEPLLAQTAPQVEAPTKPAPDKSVVLRPKLRGPIDG